MPLQSGGGTTTPPSAGTQSSWPSPAVGREVTDLQYEQLFRPSTGSGLIGVPTDPPLVYADGTKFAVSLRNSRAGQVSGFHWRSGSSDLDIPIVANGTGAVRRDLVVMGLDRSTWDVTVYVKTGTSVLPALQQDTGTIGLFEIPLAKVDVPAGAGLITPSAVTPLAWYKAPPIYTSTAATSPGHAPGQIRFLSDLNDLTFSTGTVWRTLNHDGNSGKGLIYAFRAGSGSNQAPQTRVWMSSRTIAVPAGHSLRLFADNVAFTPTGLSVITIQILVNGVIQAAGHTGPNVVPANVGLFYSTEDPNYVLSPGQATVTVQGNAIISGQGSDRVDLQEFRFTITDLGPAFPYVNV